MTRHIAIALLVFLSVAAGAHAHVVLETKDAEPGAYKAVFRVPHGCEGSPTVSITVEIPEGVIGVKPMPKPGWQLRRTHGPYARTYDHHGKTVSSGVKTVTWSGGRLLDEDFDEFVLSVTLTAGLTAGRTVYFPVLQHCEAGSTRWTEIPAAGQDTHALKRPAPGVRILAGRDGGTAQPGRRRR